MLVNPEVPAALNDIVLHAMEKNPEARFQTAEEFRNALKAVRNPQAAPAAQQHGYAPVPGVNVPAALTGLCDSRYVCFGSSAPAGGIFPS